MAERTVVWLADPDRFAEVRDALVPDEAWQQFADGEPVRYKAITMGRLDLLREARDAGAYVDKETLEFVSETGLLRPFVPFPPVMRFAGLLAVGERFPGRVRLIPGEDDLTAARIAAYQGDD